MGSTRRAGRFVSRRDVTSQVEFGLTGRFTDRPVRGQSIRGLVTISHV